MARKKKSEVAESIINGTYGQNQQTQPRYSVADSIINGTYKPNSVADDIINGTFNPTTYGNKTTIEQPQIVEQTVEQPQIGNFNQDQVNDIKNLITNKTQGLMNLTKPKTDNSFGFSIDNPYPRTPEEEQLLKNKELYGNRTDVSGYTSGRTGMSKEIEPSTFDKLDYVKQNLGMGLASGVVNMLDAPVQYVQEGAERGKDMSFYDVNFAPDNKYLRTADTLQDENMSNGGKVLDFFLEMFTGTGEIKNLFTDFGEKLGYSNNEVPEAIQNIRNTVRQPLEEKQQELNEKGKKLGGGWQTAGEVANSVGNMLPSIAASAITGNPNIGLAVMGTSAKGGSTYEAEQKGATLREANAIGLAKGGIEVGTEKLTGGIDYFGKGQFDDIVEKGINKLFKGKVSNFIAKKGMDIAGEEIEEVTSDLLGYAIDKATTDPDAEYTWDNLKNTLLITALTTGTINATSGGYSRSAYQLNTQELQEVLKNEKIQKEVDAKVEQFKTPDMNKEQVEELRKNVEAIVLGDVQNNINKVIEKQLNNIETQNNTQIPTQTPLNTLNQGVQETPYQTQTPQITPLNEANQELQETRQNDIANQVQAMNLEKQPEFKQKEGNYIYEKSENSKIDNLRKDMAKNFTESEETSKFAKTLEKIIEDKDVEIRFNPNLRDSQGRVVNGSYSDGVITINPNSNRAGEFLAIHELTHAIGTDNMIKMVEKYRKSNEEFNQAVQKLLTTYNATEINEEALADISGQLFGNQEYINNLSKEQPSLFRKIYNEIKYLWHQFRGYKNQNQFIEDLRNKWESAYRNSQAKQTSKTDYSKVENVELKQDNQGRELSKQQQEYFKDSKVRNDKGNLEVVYHTTTNSGTQFNEFNPVGTPGYRFGDQVVNYFTNSKDMSGSYADQKYEMADTQKFNNIDEVKNWLKEQKTLFDEYDIKPTLKEGAYFLTEDGQGKILFETEDKLLKEVKKKFYEYKKQFGSDKGYAKRQYEGYINITNPYVVDAEKRNWNQVVSQSNEFIDDLEERVPQDVKDNLTRLYQESANKSAEAREEYNITEQLINNGIDAYNSAVDEDIKKTNKVIKRVGYDEIEEVLNDIPMGIMGVRGWYKLADALKEVGIIGDATSSNIIDDFKLPEDIKNWLKENYNKEIPMHEIQTSDLAKAVGQLGRTTTLKDIYKKNQESYNNFDKYRMPNSYFLEQLQTEGNDYLGYELEDLFEQRAETKGADVVADEISQAASVGFSKPEMIRLWGTSKTTNDVVKEIIASNKDGKTNYDGVIIKNVYDYGGKTDIKKTANDIYITFNSNQFKNVDNTNPTNDPDIRYSKDNQTWREYLEKEFPNQGTRTDLKDITGRKQQETTKTTTKEEKPQERPKKEVKQEIKKTPKQEQNYLSKVEQEELDNLKEIDNIGWIELTKEEKARMEELEKKFQGITKKYPDLKTNNQFEDIKSIYGKYKNNEISRENNKVLNEAKNIIEANKQGRRTKEQWLQVAEYVGSNADIKNSQDLQQLAMETWFNEKPNTTSALNRQGQKYVKFTPQEWVNAVYKGAGVGTDIKLSQEEIQPKEKNTINESKQDEVVKMTSKDITKTLDDTNKGIVPDGKKMRSWIETSNVATGNENTISQADIDKITYEVQSNKKTYEQAVDNTKNMSYEQKLFNAEKKLNTNKKITPTDLAEAQLALREAATKGDTKAYLNLQQDIAIMGTELGQMVQSLSMIQKLSPDGQLLMLQKIVKRQQKLGNKAWDNVDFDEKLVQKVLDSYDDASHTTWNKEKLDEAVDDLKQNLADQLKVTISDKVNEWRYLSMLGNPKTHIRNVVANIAMTFTKRAKEKINAGLQDLLIRDPNKKTATLKRASQEVKDLSKIAYDETFEVNKGNKYNEKNEIENKRKVFNTKVIEKLRKVNAKALDLEDQAFKKIEFKRAFSNYLTAQNIKTTQDINTHPEIIQQAKAFALEESKIATFQQENQFANWINKLDKKGPIAKVVRGAVIPFTRTPLNIAKTGIEYTPGTGLIKTVADVIKAPSNMKGNVAINGISKQITGTSLALLGYALAKSGIIKSSSGDDKEDKFKKDQGLSMDFSIKLGDKYYDLSWLSPSSMPLFIGASTYEQIEKADGINGNVIMEGLANTLDPLSEMSCISSFTDILNSYKQGSSQMLSQMGQKTAQNYLSQFVPTVSSQFARLFDTKKRTTSADKSSSFTWGQETQRQLMYKIPGLRNLLPEQTDYFGETKEEEENVLLRGFEAFLSPANSKKDIASDEAKEMIRVYDETGDTDVLPSSLYKYIKYDNENYQMTIDEWNNYKKDFGTTLKDNLNEVMKSNEYKKATDDEKASIISNLMKYSKDKAKDNYLESKGKEYSDYSDKVDAKRENDYSLADFYLIKNESPKIFDGSVDTVRKKIDTANEIGISIVDYNNIKAKINEFTADKDSNGKTISNSKKQKVVNYVNSLSDLTEEQKDKLLSSIYKSW